MPLRKLVLFFLISLKVFSQENPLKIVLPLSKNIVEEGKTISLKLNAKGGQDSNYVFSISQGLQESMTIDSLGNFDWTPSFDLVERLNKEKTFQVIFNVKNQSKESDNQVFDFILIHKNRIPSIGKLKPFYLQYNAQNTYQIDAESINDPDNDPVVFIPIIDQMPEGMRLSARGEISWTPSNTQFKQLREKPLTIPFFIEDQPSKSQVKGSFKVMITQMDLRPEINCIPKLNNIVANENQLINLGFYLSDPNGDDDIAVFDFLTTNASIPKEVIIKNTSTQYEFLWQPSYDFVKDPSDSINFSITFFVLDKTQQREEKTIHFTIINTVNEIEKDTKLFTLYQSTMFKAWELLEQMKDKENELKKSYQRAKRGKKNRSIINATLGATTGLSPVLSKTLERQRIISTIGGTSVLTISTLEATEVIGRSMKDLVERLNYVIEKKNEIQTKGDIFARDFALKSARRNPEFLKKIDTFAESMSLKGLVILELDAGYTPKQKATDEIIKKIFREFSSMD